MFGIKAQGKAVTVFSGLFSFEAPIKGGNNV
jgi:hypothetical protein